MRKLFFLLISVLVLASCKKEVNSNNKLFKEVWETDNVIFKYYSGGDLLYEFIPSDNFKRWDFGYVSSSDSCYDQSINDKPRLTYTIVHNELGVLNYSDDCYFNYLKTDSNIYLSEYSTLFDDGFDVSTVEEKNNYTILSETDSKINLMSVQNDFPVDGQQTKTYLFFSKNR